MQITGANDVDIMLDEDGQPVSDGNGTQPLYRMMNVGFRILRMRQ